MKKSLIIPAIGLAVLAMAGGVIGLSHNTVLTGAKADASSPWTITDDMYEVALLESYSHHDHPFDHSKYLLGDWLSGNGAQHNFTTDLKMGAITETPNTWKFNLTRGYQKTGTTRYTTNIRASNSSSEYNICDATQYPEATAPDEYAIGQLLAAEGATFGGAMISTTTYKNITDISFYWRYQENAKKIIICYQIEGQPWKTLSGTGSVNGNYTGTRGWDTYGYTTFNSSSWKEKELYGANARIALAIGGTKAAEMQMGAVLINANQSAVRYLNALGYWAGICDGTSNISLDKNQEDSACNQDVFQLATERAEGSFLANYNVVGDKTTETNALSMYNYLVSSIPALGSVKAASSRSILAIASNNNVIIIAGVSIVLICASGVALYFFLRKKKHN